MSEGPRGLPAIPVPLVQTATLGGSEGEEDERGRDEQAEAQLGDLGEPAGGERPVI